MLRYVFSVRRIKQIVLESSYYIINCEIGKPSYIKEREHNVLIRGMGGS